MSTFLGLIFYLSIFFSDGIYIIANKPFVSIILTRMFLGWLFPPHSDPSELNLTSPLFIFHEGDLTPPSAFM